MHKNLNNGVGKKAYTRASSKGRQAGRLDERFAITKNLLNEGADIQLIQRTTKLSEEEINRLHLH